MNTTTPTMNPQKMMTDHINPNEAANPAVHTTLGEKVTDYMKKMPSCPTSLRSTAREVLLSFTRLVQDGNGAPSWDVVCLLAAALLYLLSPVDAVPDAIPVAGWADDLAVLLYALRVLKARCNTEKTTETQD